MSQMMQHFHNDFELALSQLSTQLYSGSDELATACHYALAGQGKRVRPKLIYLCNQLFGGSSALAMEAGLALEMVHTYSLVHDDLPCLDNDSVRRGRATLHVKFNEPTALLAGDALLTDAFAVLTHTGGAELIPMLKDLAPLAAECRLMMVAELAKAAGGAGMVFGQALDMYWTKRQDYTQADLDQIHLNKTGRLISCACTLGALSAGVCDGPTLARFRKFGECIGLAFQISDDLLDTTVTMGKSTNKDRQQGKLTYLSMLTAEQAFATASQLTEDASAQMQPYTPRADQLLSFVNDLLHRKH